MKAKDGLNPWILAISVVVFGLACYLFGIPQTYASAVFITASLFVILLNPFNGLILITLLVPFFLGESGWSYYWLIEVLVYSTALSMIIHSLALKHNYRLALLVPMALLAMSSLFSLPIDGKEFVFDFWVTSLEDLFWQWLVAHPAPKVHYLRQFMNMVTGMVLFWLAYNYIKDDTYKKFTTLASSMAFVATVVCVCGIAMYYGPIKTPDGVVSYLSLSVVGRFGISITAFSYALHFYGQYLLLTLPFILFLFFKNIGRDHLLTALSVVSILLLSFTLLQGGLRTTTALLYLIFLVSGLIVMKMIFGPAWYKRPSALITFIIVVLAAGVYLKFSPAYDRMITEVFSRQRSPILNEIYGYIDNPLYFMGKGISEPRFFLWHTAIRMFWFAPLLGIGMGRYTHLFREYYNSDWYNWEDIGFAAGATAHSSYFEILANRGLLGIFFSALLIMLLVLAAYRSRSSVDSNRMAVLLTLISVLLVTLLLIVTHHLALCRAIDLLIWISLGMLAGACFKEIEKIQLGKKFIYVSVGVLVIALGLQFALISKRAVTKEYFAGFYNWERQPDGAIDRWMGRRGVVNVISREGMATIAVRCPLPGLDKTPQKLKIWSGDQVRQLEFTGDSLESVSFKVPTGQNSAIIWLEAEYVFNPKERKINDDDRNLGVMVRWPGES